MTEGMKSIRAILILVLACMIACVEPYIPPNSIVADSYLVVDGFLNAGKGSATIKLTRAVRLSSGNPNPPEQEASVTIESQKGQSIVLSETDKGIYEANEFIADGTVGYRLKIKTSNGQSYTSDYIEMRQSPVLDSVSWTADDKGTYFYVSGHDPLNKTTYYRYLFDETWEYRTTYVSDWKKEGTTPVFRNPTTEQVYTCWKTSYSTEILTTSTKRLSSDVVSLFPINFIKKGSRELSRIYSMNVQQRAISQEEYEYWDLIRKTTESLGGLFDPLPSQVIGNVHNDSNPNEQVLGYFTGGFVNEKRIFVFQQQLPGYLQTVDPFDFECTTSFVPIDHPELAGDNVFVATVGIPPIGWTVSTANCADCRALGGDNQKPTFWPQ
jgi:hypothetical protein